jgi:hypothetical protein
MWLGGRYANIVKPGYAARVPTKAEYWTFLIYILLRVLLGIFLYHMYLTISRLSPAVYLTDSLARFQMFTSLNKRALRSSKN